MAKNWSSQRLKERKEESCGTNSCWVWTLWIQQWHVIESILYLYYKSWNNWNLFSPILGPPYPSQRSHLSGQRFDEKGCRPMKLIEGKCFHQNPNIFYTKHSSTHLLYPHITFLCHTLYFPFHALTHNSRRYLFWKDNNWHHCFMEGKERHVLFLE